MLDYKKFFDGQKDLPEEKGLWWKGGLAFAGLILAQILLILPFILAMYLFGKKWAVVGWVIVIILALLFYLFRRIFIKSVN